MYTDILEGPYLQPHFRSNSSNHLVDLIHKFSKLEEHLYVPLGNDVSVLVSEEFKNTSSSIVVVSPYGGGVISTRPIRVENSWENPRILSVEAYPTQEFKDGSSFLYLNYNIKIDGDKFRLEKVNLIGRS